MTPRNGLACGVCDVRLPDEEVRALHHARRHDPHELTGTQRARATAALEREAAQLQQIRRHVRAGLVSLPVLLVAFASLVITAYTGNTPALALLLVPGLVAFAALFYGMTYAFGGDSDERRA